MTAEIKVKNKEDNTTTVGSVVIVKPTVRMTSKIKSWLFDKVSGTAFWKDRSRKRRDQIRKRNAR